MLDFHVRVMSAILRAAAIRGVDSHGPIIVLPLRFSKPSKRLVPG